MLWFYCYHLDDKVVNGEKEGSGDEEPAVEEELYYDKNKSFFDNISCEATERAKGYVGELELVGCVANLLHTNQQLWRFVFLLLYFVYSNG